MIQVEWARIPGTIEVRKTGKFPRFTGLRLGNGAKFDPESLTDEKWTEGMPPLQIESFGLAVYPVTVAQFRPFGKQGYRDDRWWSAAGGKERRDRTHSYWWDDPAWTLDNHPVVRVTWYDAEAYCNWLNEQLCLPAGTIRLPTEAEWEWAARGPEGRRYPWGDKWEAWRCNSEESGINRTSAVGCFPGGAADWWRVLDSARLAVHDLAGNVWEWTASEYTEDYRGACRLVSDDNTDTLHSVRGGAWYNWPCDVRAAFRGRDARATRLHTLGFRLAMTMGEQNDVS